MKAVMLMFDSLNRNMLQPYGCQWTRTPNFQRLAERSVRFDNCYAGSLPCMPARRELHTGRYNFLHRSWGPVEPFDDSMPQILKDSGIYSHLVSDHIHYWEDGGATYHQRYSSWEVIRGQEGDKWKCLPELFDPCEKARIQNRDGLYFQSTRDLQRHDAVNRQFMKREEDTALAQTFEKGLEFLDANGSCDRWFLQIECFDPHEPFFSPERFRELYPDDYDGPETDWPPYYYVTEDPEKKKHLKHRYAALLSMCDHYLGKILDKFDELDLWKDTMLIVNTDHGYLLGEHGWWSKVIMPCYDEIVHIPLFIHDPRFDCGGQSRDQIVQTIDLPATILEFFGIDLPVDMQGKSIRKVVEESCPIRDCALFGIHGAHVNIFDGRYVYMKAPVSESNGPLYEYTLMPNHMRTLFSVEELKKAEAVPGDSFSFTKNCPVWKIPKGNGNGSRDFSELLIQGRDSEEAKHIDNNSLVNAVNFGDKLFDMKLDPGQERELDDDRLESRMACLLIKAMKDNDCPPEQLERLGLKDGGVTVEDIRILKERSRKEYAADVPGDRQWTRGAANMYRALLRFVPKENRKEAGRRLCDSLRAGDAEQIDTDAVMNAIPRIIPREYVDMVTYFVGMSGRTK